MSAAPAAAVPADAPVSAVQDPYTALQLTIKELDWAGNGLKKENAMLEEELTRISSQDCHIQASWDYALSLRRGEELERRCQELEQQLAALRRTYEADDDDMTAAEWAGFPTMQEDLTALEKRHAELQQVPLPPPPPLLCPDLRGVCTRRLRPFRRRNAPWTRT
jgi:predicted  nucleic acid-binding Zn-ribbon protein